MNSIKDSIVADRGSIIENAKIDNSVNINKIKKKSFLKGFISGFFASLIASVIWYLIQIFIIK